MAPQVNTETLHRSTIHPHSQEQQLPHIQEPERLAPADRIAFRIGLWLLQRSFRNEQKSEPQPHRPHHREPRGISEHQAITLLIHTQQQKLR